MSCQGCFNGCGTPVPDKCVKYTGPDISFPNSTTPDICTNDPLYKVEEVLISKITALINATGIKPNTVLGCDYLTTLLNGADITASKLFEIYAQAICELKDDVEAIETIINTSTVFNTGCLTGLSTNPTRDQILQALLNKVCSDSTKLTAIEIDYVKATQLNSLIAQYLNSQSGNTQQSAKMVPRVAYEYYGSLSNFDSNGRGLASAGFDKVYICNGQNGTPDKRGRVAVGAVAGVPGGALDPAVDPTLLANTGTNYALNQKFGASNITLDTTQIPAHTHGVTDPGHTHLLKSSHTSTGVIIYSDPRMSLGDASGTVNSASITSSTTGISINATGSNQPHSNVQPSIAAYYIMFIP
jgi:microcystin-dependent protein